MAECRNCGRPEYEHPPTAKTRINCPGFAPRENFLEKYPYRDTRPGARCFLWHHEAAVVQWLAVDDREHYTCACGKFTWLFGGRKERVQP